MEQVITLKDVVYRTGTSAHDIEILRGVDLDVCSGQVFAIHGRSGSGKSTLLSVIAGLIKPSSGTVEVLGLPYHSLSDEERTAARRGRIGFVYQDFQLLPNLNAWDNAVLPLRLLGRKTNADEVRGKFEQFGLGKRTHHFPAQLSGGEQQRVAILRALLVNPEIVLADEPTGNLDINTAKDFIDILGRIARDDGAAVVVVTHDESLIATSDRRLELS
ncbi:MAG: ABC transporter ATP-binding protein [Gammaproteobacteria bacterium]|nr:ABC transporter ATP-binding protein [Gammaproteobacteria bacterium]